MTHPIHDLALLIEEIVSPFRAYAIEKEIEMLDFTKLDTALADIKTEVGAIEANQTAAVAKAVADTEAADQAQLDAKVAADVNPAAVGFPEPAAPPATPEPITISPTSLAAGALSGSFVASGGTGNLTFTPATSSNGDVTVDAAGAYTGTGIEGETLDVTVTDEADPPVVQTTIVSIA